jgi:hypothetical protein
MGRSAALGIFVAAVGFVIGVSISAATSGDDGSQRRSVADMSASERAKVMNIKTLPNGKTLGTFPVEDVYFTDDDLPDFLGVFSDYGQQGYIRKEDYIGPQPSSPAEALAMPETRVVPVFAEDGETVIGQFTFGDRVPVDDEKVQDEPLE